MAKYGDRYPKGDLIDALKENVGINDNVQIFAGRGPGKVIFEASGVDTVQVVVDSAGYFRISKIFPTMPPEYLSNDGQWVPQIVIDAAKGTPNYDVLQQSTHFANTGFSPQSVDQAREWYDGLVAQEPHSPAPMPSDDDAGSGAGADEGIGLPEP